MIYILFYYFPNSLSCHSLNRQNDINDKHFINPSLIFFFLLKTSSNHETLNKYCTIYKITIFILSAVVGLGLADAYEKEEPCGSLRSYALVAIILIFIMWMIISLINGIYIILMTWVFCRNR